MQDVHQLKETTRAISDSQGLAVLATQGNKGPYGSLVAFAATADLKSLLFATTRATRKYANLVKNGGVALVIDTRTNRKADFADAAAVTALGAAEEVAGPERRELGRIYLEKHPLPEGVRGIADHRPSQGVRDDLRRGEPGPERAGTPRGRMSLILPFERITEADRPRVGGKACALSLMAGTGAAVPSGVCITVDAYRRYAKRTGIADRIRLELSRKRFADMHWEEVWYFCMAFQTLFDSVLWCASMLFVVRFHVGCGAYWLCWLIALRQKNSLKKKAPCPLYLLLTSS